jgi:hypothetical protein
MSKYKGFLLVTMEPPPAIEEEFNDWYDTEHVPERASIRGFESAHRYVCVNGWPRYVAIYDLSHVNVLDEPGYKAVSGNLFSPWSKRLLPRVRGQYRAAGDQVYPGYALTGQCARMLLLRFLRVGVAAKQTVVDGACSAFEGKPGIKQVRVLQHDSNGSCDFIVLVESEAPFDLTSLPRAEFGSAAASLDTVNEYVRHWVRGQLPGVYTEGGH